MALGTPIVATDIEPIRETVGRDGALLVPPGSSPALAEALAFLLAEPDRRRQLSQSGRDRFQRHYNLTSITDLMADLYRQVAGLAAPRPA
jgi:glycosyltransferase involved in cell wall biosynthesis